MSILSSSAMHQCRKQLRHSRILFVFVAISLLPMPGINFTICLVDSIVWVRAGQRRRDEEVFAVRSRATPTDVVDKLLCKSIRTRHSWTSADRRWLHWLVVKMTATTTAWSRIVHSVFLSIFVQEYMHPAYAEKYRNVDRFFWKTKITDEKSLLLNNK